MDAPRQTATVQVDDRELLEHARSAKNGAKFEALWRGDTSGYGGDDSAADLALCGLLAFWCGIDPRRIDSLFRSSGLMRDKWDSSRGETTYGRQTIEKALRTRTEFYDWSRRLNGSAHHHAEPSAADETQPSRPLVIRASSVKSTSVRWAWTGRLLIGYLTVLTGIEGLGKSVFAAWMISGLTRGGLGGEWRGQPVDCLIVASEDGIADTWKPRLDLAGGDTDKIAFLNLSALPSDWNLRDGIADLRAAVAATSAKAVFIDAALDHMPAPSAGESINSPTFVRQALGPLRQAARELEFAGAFSMHPPKTRSAEFRDLVQASQAFSAIPRVGLLLAHHPDDTHDDPYRRRVLIRGKGNLGRDPGALEFKVVGRAYKHDDGRLEEREVVADVGPSPISLADLAPGRMIGERDPTKAEQAADVVRDALSDGEWHPAETVRSQLAALDLDSGSVRSQAKRLAGWEARKRADGAWEWRTRQTRGTGSFGFGGPLDPLPPARARSLTGTDPSPKNACNPNEYGKGPRVRACEESATAESKGPSTEGYRACEREDAGDVENDPFLDQVLRRHGDDS